MKLNATYSLTSGTSVDPAYLNPSFEMLSDDSDVFTSTTKVKSSAISAPYSSVAASNIATADVGIIMDLGSLKAISSLRIKGSAGIEYGSGSFTTVTSNPIVTYIYGSDASFTSTIDVKNFGNTNKFVSGNASILNSAGDVEYMLVNDNYDCSLTFPSSIPSNAPKFFDTNQTARYKIQYSVTGNAYLDFQDNVLTTISGQPLDLTVQFPSNIGQIRYIKLSCVGTASNPIRRKFAYKASSTINDAIYVLVKEPVSESIETGSVTFVNNNSTTELYPIITVSLGNSPIMLDVIGVRLFPGTVLGGDLEYSTDGSNWISIPNNQRVISVLNDSGTSLITLTNPVSARAIRFKAYNINSFVSSINTSKYAYAQFYSAWVGKRKACPYLAFGAGSNISVTGGSIIDSFLVLSSFYADDGVSSPTISITSNTPSTVTASGGSATISVGATASQGTSISYQWQKKESNGSTFINIANATSSSLVLNNLTNSSDNNDQYQVIVSAPGAASITSNVTTLFVPQQGTAYSVSALINDTPAVLYDNTLNEGQILKINITASKAPETFSSTSIPLYWRRIGSASDNDFATAIPGGTITLSGTIQSVSGQLILSPKEDLLTEGLETFTIVFYDDGAYTNEVARTSVFSINDTSVGNNTIPPSNTPTPLPMITPTPTRPEPSATRDAQGCFIIPKKFALSATPTSTMTGTPTTTPTRTPPTTPPNTPAPTRTPTRTNTPFPTVTPTNEPTNTPRLSQTPTQTPTPSVTPSQTGTPQPTPTPTKTLSATPAPTVTPTLSLSVSLTPTIPLTPTPSGPPCNPPQPAPIACPPCNGTIIIGYNEYIDPRCGLYRIPIYECVYIPDCGQS